MKRGFIVLIAGFALFISGLVVTSVWAVSFAGPFISQPFFDSNTVLSGATIDAGKSIQIKAEISKPGALSLAIGTDNAGMSSELESEEQPISGIRMEQKVLNPQGVVISRNEFEGSFFTTINPNTTGTFILELTNMGSGPVSVSAAFGQIPFLGFDPGSSDIRFISDAGGSLSFIVAGAGLVLAGIATIIAGAVILAVDSRSLRGASETTSRGGITYRKD